MNDSLCCPLLGRGAAGSHWKATALRNSPSSYRVAFLTYSTLCLLLRPGSPLCRGGSREHASLIPGAPLARTLPWLQGKPPTLCIAWEKCPDRVVSGVGTFFHSWKLSWGSGMVHTRGECLCAHANHDWWKRGVQLGLTHPGNTQDKLPHQGMPGLLLGGGGGGHCGWTVWGTRVPVERSLSSLLGRRSGRPPWRGKGEWRAVRYCLGEVYSDSHWSERRCIFLVGSGLIFLGKSQFFSIRNPLNGSMLAFVLGERHVSWHKCNAFAWTRVNLFIKATKQD